MKKNKYIYRFLLIFGFVLINAFLLFGIGEIMAYLYSGANKSSLFHGDEAITNYYNPSVVWKNIENRGRTLEKPTQLKIENDYLGAWYIKSYALKNNTKEGIEDYYTQKARSQLYHTIDENSSANTTIDYTTLAHNITLEFYSADGNLIVLTDNNVRSYSRVFEQGRLLFETPEIASYRVILLLEDGNWRIRHLEKISSEELVLPTSNFEEEITAISGFNYYPQENPWDTFGDSFSTEILSQDFKIIKELELNTIRIFIGYEDFGSGNVASEKIKKLQQLLDIAEKEGLQVVITLFDFYGNYTLQDWTQTQSHLIAIVNAVINHPALWGWDIKNEPNLDFDSRGKELVTSWLKQMIISLKSIDNCHPVTIGWSNAESSLLLENEVDMVSFHYYKDIENLSYVYNSLKEKTKKPILLEEFGLSTYRGIWNPFGASEKTQKEYYETFFKIQKRDSIHYLSWTLFDYGDIPNRVAGRLPWRKNKQSYFGIIDNSGAKKEAYDSFLNK